MGACASSGNAGGNVAVAETKATPRATIIPSKSGKNAAQKSLQEIGAQLASELNDDIQLASEIGDNGSPKA